MKVSVVVLCLLLSAVPLFAADVDGKWSGSVETPNGHVEVGFTFKADNGALTGTATGALGTEVAIKNGKVDGDKISFSVDVDGGGTALTIAYTGVVSAEEIKLTADVMGMPVEFVVKPAK